MGPIDGRQVKAARAILGFTQEALARVSGVHKNTVWRAEGCEGLGRSPSFDAIGTALAPLGITFDQDGADAIVRFPFEKQSMEIKA